MKIPTAISMFFSWWILVSKTEDIDQIKLRAVWSPQWLLICCFGRSCTIRGQDYSVITTFKPRLVWVWVVLPWSSSLSWVVDSPPLANEISWCFTPKEFSSWIVHQIPPDGLPHGVWCVALGTDSLFRRFSTVMSFYVQWFHSFTGNSNTCTLECLPVPFLLWPIVFCTWVFSR